VVTDHHSLCWLSNLRDPTGRLARWALRLQEYDVTIVYKSGNKHADADALSRCPVDDLPDSKCSAIAVGSSVDIAGTLKVQSFGELVSLQEKDESIALPLRFLRGELQATDSVTTAQQSKWHRLYLIRQRGLFRRCYDLDGERECFVVPRALRKTLLQHFHDDPSAGHLGFVRTYERARQSVFWRGMQRDISKYVHSCEPCQHRKRPHRTQTGSLQPIIPPERPFELVGIDFLGPLPLSETGNRYILTSVEYLTRYAETRAVVAADSKTVAQFYLQQVALRHGPPSRLISDRGTAFLSKMMEEVFRLSKTVHTVQPLTTRRRMVLQSG